MRLLRLEEPGDIQSAKQISEGYHLVEVRCLTGSGGYQNAVTAIGTVLFSSCCFRSVFAVCFRDAMLWAVFKGMGSRIGSGSHSQNRCDVYFCAGALQDFLQSVVLLQKG